MKSISVKLVAIFFMMTFIMLTTIEAWGKDWWYYGTKDDVGQYFYDKDSIVSLPDGVVRLWERVIKDEDLKKAIEEKREAIQKFIERKVSGRKDVPTGEVEKIYEEWQKAFLRDLTIREKRMLIELKCGDKMFRLISGIEYDAKGNVEKILSIPQAGWLPIAAETPIEALYKIMCPEQSK
jgi:hypothetical protein